MINIVKNGAVETPKNVTDIIAKNNNFLKSFEHKFITDKKACVAINTSKRGALWHI